MASARMVQPSVAPAGLNLTPTGRLSKQRVASMCDDELRTAAAFDGLAAGSFRLVWAEMQRRGIR